MKDETKAQFNDKSIKNQQRNSELGTPEAERQQQISSLNREIDTLHRVIENSEYAFVVCDTNLNVVEVNKHALKYYSKSNKKEKLIGIHITELIPSIKRAGNYNKYQDLINGSRTLVTHTAIIDTKSGKARLAIKAFKVNNSIGIIIKDVTELKSTEQNLTKNERRFNVFIENAPYAILTYDLKGTILYVNKKTETLTRYPREELIGKNITDPSLLDKESLSNMQATLEQYKHHEVAGPTEYTAIVKGGSRLYLEVVSVPTIIHGKREVFAIARDISQNKIAAEKAKQLEISLRIIREANTSSTTKKKRDSFLQSTCDNLIDTREYNSAWIALFDEAGNIITSAHSGVGHEFKSIINRLKTGKSPKCIENALRNPDVIVSDNPLINCCDCPLSMLYYGIECISTRFKYNNSYGIITASLPYTLAHDAQEQRFLKEIAEYLSYTIYTIELEEERKLIEGALRQKEEKYRLLLENLNEGIWQMDDGGYTAFVNPRMAQMLGYTEDEIAAKHFFTFIDRRNIDRAAYLLERCRKGIREQHEFEFLKKDGSILYASLEASPIMNEDGAYLGTLAAVQDITQRKLIGEELTLVEKAVESSSEAIGISTPEGKHFYQNKAFTELTGYTVEELNAAGGGIAAFADRNIGQAIFNTIMNGESWVSETELLSKAGHRVSVLCRADAIKDEKGKIIGLMGTFHDITERKREKELLAESEEKHRALVETYGKAGIGIVILQSTSDREAAIVFANKQAGYISGYSHEELISMSLEDAMTPEEYANIIARYRNRQKGMTVRGYYETNIICKDGTVLPIEISAAALKLHSGRATVVYFKEIASRKKAEEKIALNAKHMQAILSVAQMINQTPTMNRMLAISLDKLNEVMSTDKACVYLIDLENKCLKMKSCRGLSDKNIRRYSNLKLTEEQLHNLLMWKDPGTSFEAIFGKTTGDRLKAALERNKARSYAMVPLLLKDKVVGILYNISDKDRTITEDDIKFLTAIAYEISIGINSIQLLERTVEMSLTDELTGLYNRRHLYESLETEMSRTKRYGQPFSLVLLDLDGFKEYNDKFGHTSGDGVLQLFSKELKLSLRKTDIACRYGGDEFAIILPSADNKTAKTIIERFRIRWRKNSDKLLTIMKSPIDFSCGIAKFPDNSESADGLVFLADAAMYCAKVDREHKSMIAAEISSIPSDILQAATQEHIYALAATVDAKDPHTYGHSKRVAAIAEKIGKAIGLSKEALSELYAAALLHDIGKIGVPDSILTKPDRLTPEEWAIIKNHSAEGANIVGYVKELTKLVPTILHHHEWYDGKGYPYGLKGNIIPIGARITSVADAYDTMTTERPYRNVVSPSQACEELNRCAGTQFDPMIVDIWCKTILEPN